MSFIKKYLPEIEAVIESIETTPDLYYMNNAKVDVFFGPSKSAELTNEFIEKYKENPGQDFSELTTKYK